MKATLEFDLPDDADSHLLAVHAADLYSSLWDIDQELRSYLKHGHKFASADEALEAVRNSLHDGMSRRGVNLDMVS